MNVCILKAEVLHLFGVSILVILMSNKCCFQNKSLTNVSAREMQYIYIK